MIHRLWPLFDDTVRRREGEQVNDAGRFRSVE